jgi:hypothetical protein
VPTTASRYVLRWAQPKPTKVKANHWQCSGVQIWVFDQPDGMPRLLRSRSGHGAPPVHLRYIAMPVLIVLSIMIMTIPMLMNASPAWSFCRFYGPSGHELLSAGLDRAVRAFSMIRDAQNVELSQGSVARSAKKLGMRIDELRLPPVIAMAAEELRARDWDNVVTCHLHELEARTWRWADKALGRHVLKPPGAVPAGTEAKVCAYGLLPVDTPHADGWDGRMHPSMAGLCPCSASPCQHAGTTRSLATRTAPSTNTRCSRAATWPRSTASQACSFSCSHSLEAQHLLT